MAVRRNSRSKARNILARIAGSVQIEVDRDTVGKLCFRNVHTTVKKVDNSFLAGVLDHFQARDGNRGSVLRDGELSRADGEFWDTFNTS